MYAVKVTYISKMRNGAKLVRYVGKRGESKLNPDKIEGWKRRETAEKWIDRAVECDEFFNEILLGDTYYDVVEL